LTQTQNDTISMKGW